MKGNKKLEINLLGMSIILGITLLISIGCFFIIHRIFKKAKLDLSKDFRKDVKIAFANSFVAGSIFSIAFACIIYGFLGNILEKIGLESGLINYTVFASKIWFISSPFIGLEIAIFEYFNSLSYYKKPIIILLIKLLVFIIICALYYSSRKTNCFIYAKPVCDFIFLLYYSKICFDITISNKT